MTARYAWITFDCYGTLVDWEGGIRDAFDAAAGRAGRTIDPDAVIAAHAEIEPQVQAGAYRTYREVLRETARRIAARLDWPMDDAEAEFLPDSLPRWRPFDDTADALRRLRSAGARLGILSNIDDDLIAGTMEHIGVPFDMTITAEQLRSYKPAPPHFETARERIAGASWLHAAQSLFHDVAPCRAMGIPTAWINRGGDEAGEARPDVEFPDVAGLADWFAAAG